jgi:hypothetical protein
MSVDFDSISHLCPFSVHVSAWMPPENGDTAKQASNRAGEKDRAATRAASEI